MNQQFFRLLRLGFASLDLIALNLAFGIGKYIFREKIDPSWEIRYTYLWIFLNLAWLVSSWACRTYERDNISSFESFGRRTLRAFIYFLAMMMVYLFFQKWQDVSRLFILSSIISMGIALLLNRLVYLLVFQYFRNRENLMRKVIIIGYNDISKKLVEELEDDPINTEIIGYCENEEDVHELSNYPIVGNLSNVMEVSRKYNATEIFSSVAPEQNESIYELIQVAEKECIRFRLIPNFSFFARFPMHVDYFGSIPVLSLRKEPLDDVANRIKKRMFDIVVSSIAIILVLSWLIPLMSLLIWFESRGPIFFYQKRSGKGNRPFTCIKFRSMRMNEDSHKVQATKGDRRITRIGKFLRRSNLDEFPQFLNVFMGQMSIVGPRPHMLKHTDDYSAMINKYMVRQFVKPGITGWAQVNGYRGEVRTMEDMEKRVEHDLWYLENWSLWLDTRIIFLTVYNMIRGEKNAY